MATVCNIFKILLENTLMLIDNLKCFEAAPIHIYCIFINKIEAWMRASKRFIEAYPCQQIRAFPFYCQVQLRRRTEEGASAGCGLHSKMQTA